MILNWACSEVVIASWCPRIKLPGLADVPPPGPERDIFHNPLTLDVLPLNSPPCALGQFRSAVTNKCIGLSLVVPPSDATKLPNANLLKLLNSLPCPSGQFRSAVTKKCIDPPFVIPPSEASATGASALPHVEPSSPLGSLPCPSGQFRSPGTNKCIDDLLSTPDDLLSTPDSCPLGQFRNRVTNKCMAIVLPPSEASATSASALPHVEPSSPLGSLPCPSGQFYSFGRAKCIGLATQSDGGK